MSMKPKSFTISTGKRANLIIFDVNISQITGTKSTTIESNLIKIKAMFDTGATNGSISGSAIKKLALRPSGKTVKVLHTGGSMYSAVYEIDIILPNQIVFPKYQVIEAFSHRGGIDLTMGMDVITCGDLAITTVNGNTVLSFRVPSLEIIDFQ